MITALLADAASFYLRQVDARRCFERNAGGEVERVVVSMSGRD